MDNRKKSALSLRKQGKSYNEINKKLGIAKSTLSYWFKKNKKSEELKKRLTKKAQIQFVKKLRIMAKARRQQALERHAKYRKHARGQFKLFKKDPLFFLGIGIYSGEGDKSFNTGCVRVSNTDAHLLKKFVDFLNRYCSVDIEQLRAWILLYPDNNEKKCKKYWSKIIGIPKEQFVKSQRIFGKHKTKRLQHGVCAVYLCSREIKEKILEWIKLCESNIEIKNT